MFLRVHQIGLMFSGSVPTFPGTPPYLGDSEIELLGFHVFQTLVFSEGKPRMDLHFLRASLRVAYDTTCRLKQIHFAEDNILTPKFTGSFGLSLSLYLIRWATHGVDSAVPTISFPSHSHLELWGPRIISPKTQHIDIQYVDDVFEIASVLSNWYHSGEMNILMRP